VVEYSFINGKARSASHNADSYRPLASGVQAAVVRLSLNRH
jgi:hypothetical protein